MPDTYRPRFSRRTLKTLLVVLPGLILLLASLGPAGTDIPIAEKWPDRELYWLEQPDSPYHEVRLIYATGLAIAPAQRLVQQAMAAQLESRLTRHDWPATISAQADHLQLRLSWPAAAGVPDLSPLLQLLTAPEPIPETQLQRLQAQQYLAGQQPDQILLNRFLSQLQPPASPANLADRWQALQAAVSGSPPRVLIGGPRAPDIAARTADSLPEGAPRPATSIAPLQPVRQLRLQLDDARHPSMRLLGGAAAGRDSPDYANELLAFTSLRLLLDAQPSMQYRLQWQALHQGGFRALVLPATLQDPESLLRKAAAPVRRAREQLLLQYRALLDAPSGQLDELVANVLYQRPQQPLDAIIGALEAADEDDIGARMSHYLDPEPLIRIELNGTGLMESGEW
ncbi:hypothetical protein GCM10011348_08160 [Marinobacterium nitratireducens]|uniref:Uncharacterized protein n=1 Tax=Marinobacterium nitratireducens TaxID=518897 RepID=A0A917ZAW9_9GAMM|nr:hypothetical protein [Marinobacterium nitratireducens]GGO77793.1 hypothetical protein GCM10011348_08160 [Marinobacterium nitratireducens]